MESLKYFIFSLKISRSILCVRKTHGRNAGRSPPECDVQCQICRVHVLENRCPVNLVRSRQIDAIRNRNRRGPTGTEARSAGWLSFAKRLPKRHCAISREYDRRGKRYATAAFWPFDLLGRRLCVYSSDNADGCTARRNARRIDYLTGPARRNACTFLKARA